MRHASESREMCYDTQTIICSCHRIRTHLQQVELYYSSIRADIYDIQETEYRNKLYFLECMEAGGFN